MARLSVKHALTDDELEFCKVYSAFGEKNPTDAYRRSHLVRSGSDWYFPGDDGKPTLGDDGTREPPVPPKAVSKLAQAVLKLEHVQEYIAEIRRPASDQARQVIVEQAILGDDREARAAAKEIMALEDKMGFRDTVLRHAEILCEIGTEVVVPLPQKIEEPVFCPSCSHEFLFVKKLEVAFDINDMFPDIKERVANAKE